MYAKKMAFIAENFIKKQVTSCRLNLHYVGNLNSIFEYFQISHEDSDDIGKQNVTKNETNILTSVYFLS